MANMIYIAFKPPGQAVLNRLFQVPQKNCVPGFVWLKWDEKKNPWTNTLDPNVKSKASIHIAKKHIAHTIFIFFTFHSLGRPTQSPPRV